jgi:hypothetical protein
MGQNVYGQSLDAEKVLVHGFFQPSADAPPLIPSWITRSLISSTHTKTGRERLASPSP